MNKALEAFNKIKKFKDDCCMFGSSDIEIDKELGIIETALKEYETIKDVRITARFDLKQVSKEHRALEIIKEKPVVALVDYKYTYEEWLDLVDEKDKDLFRSKEEYDLLKEVLS